MKITNRKKIYLGGVFLLIFLILNPLFLEKFTTDGQINSDNLLVIINILSYSNLIVFLLVILKSDFLIKVKKNIKNLIIFLFVFFLGLILCEILLKKYNNFLNINKTINVENFEFKASYSYNSFGFRDKNFDKNEKNKLIFLGDSFVFGSAVDNNYTFNRIVEEKFKVENKKNIRVFNLGIPGAEPANYLKTFQNFKYLEPQVTVVFLYVDNDIIASYASSLKRKIVSLVSDIEILNILSKYFYKKNNIKNILDKYQVNHKYRDLFNKNLINPYILPRGSQDTHLLYENFTKDFNNNNYTKNNLLKINKLAKEIKSKFILVIIPSKYQVNKKYLSYLKKELNFNVSRYDIVNDNLQKSIIKWAKDNEIETIDILPHLKNDHQEYYYLIDDHFNKNGNLLVANILFERLKLEFK
jgi:hypothetical protein